MSVDVPRLLAALGIAVEWEDRGELYALCPLPGHADTKPSWSIRSDPGNERNGRHHCFSCGRGGTAATLVADVLGLDADAARDWLERGGLASPEVLAEELEVVTIDPLSRASSFRLPLGVMFRPLEEWPTQARRYAIEQRRLEPWQVERWSIGYGVFGRCAGRIVIPVYSEAGELVSYQARAFDGRDKDRLDPRPKYLTPAREEGPGAWPFFGAHLWSSRGRIVLAEGAFKALACERAGEDNVGAICGSTLAPEHVLALQSFEQVVLVKDRDQAGDGVLAQVQSSLGRWRELKVVEPPEGHDADSMPLAELERLLGATR